MNPSGCDARRRPQKLGHRFRDFCRHGLELGRHAVHHSPRFDVTLLRLRTRMATISFASLPAKTLELACLSANCPPHLDISDLSRSKHYFWYL